MNPPLQSDVQEHAEHRRNHPPYVIEMSKELLKSVEDYLQGNFLTNKFVDFYINAWKAERDNGELLKDDPVTSEKLSTFFCLVDLYEPDDDREVYEFDEAELRKRMQRVFDGDLSP